MNTSSYLAELASKFNISSLDPAELSLSLDNSSIEGSGSGSASDLDSTDSNQSIGESIENKSSTTATVTTNPTNKKSTSSGESKSASVRSKSSASTSNKNRSNKSKSSLLSHYNVDNVSSNSTLSGSLTSQLNSLQYEYSNSKSNYESRIRQLEHSLALQSASASRELQSAQLIIQQLTAERDSLKQTINNNTSTAYSNTSTLNNKQLDYIKSTISNLTDLIITESQYIEYSQLPIESLTISQYISIQLYNLLLSYQTDKDNILSENKSIHTKLIELKSQYSILNDEYQLLQRQSNRKLSELESELNLVLINNKSIQQQLIDKTNEFNSLSSQYQTYNELKLKYNTLETAHIELEKQYSINQYSLKAATDSNTNNTNKLTELESTVELLKQDKLYLTSQISILNDKYLVLDELYNECKSKLSTVKSQRNKLSEQLLSNKIELDKYYSDRLNNELKSISDRTSTELELIRNNSKLNYEREIQLLTQSKSELSIENQKLTSSINQLKENYQTVLEQSQKLNSTLESERNNHLNQIKLKDFEYERLGLTFEESMNEFRQLKISYESQLQKNQILKQEYYTIQSELNTIRITAESELNSLKEKLSIYQQLEYELDSAIMTAGHNAAVEAKSGVVTINTGGSAGSISGINRILESVGNSMPVANKRRLKQSLLLAQQLVEKQSELQSVQQQLITAQSTISELTQRIELIQNQFELISNYNNQSNQQYILSVLQTKDNTIIELKRENSNLLQSIESIRSTMNKLIKEKSELELELKSIIQTKSKLNSLKDLLGANNNNNNNNNVSKGKENISPINNNNNNNPSYFNSTIPEPDNGALPPIWFRKLQK